MNIQLFNGTNMSSYDGSLSREEGWSGAASKFGYRRPQNPGISSASDFERTGSKEHLLHHLEARGNKCKEVE